jgi:small-conductance mechanosensitive channel
MQGKVDSINYQSTQLVTLDGSVIAFQNATLFSKNFKNLTRNHGYVMVKVPVGVAYGVNVEKVRNMLLKDLDSLMVKNAAGKYVCDKKQGFKVLFDDFGDSSVDLFVVCWVLVEEKAAFVAKVKEVIYNTLNKNKIEIPFPQQDIYVRHIELPSGRQKNNDNASVETVETGMVEEPAAATAPKKRGRPRKSTKKTTENPEGTLS